MGRDIALRGQILALLSLVQVLPARSPYNGGSEPFQRSDLAQFRHLAATVRSPVMPVRRWPQQLTPLKIIARMEKNSFNLLAGWTGATSMVAVAANQRPARTEQQTRSVAQQECKSALRYALIQDLAAPGPDRYTSKHDLCSHNKTFERGCLPQSFDGFKRRAHGILLNPLGIANSFTFQRILARTITTKIPRQPSQPEHKNLE